MSFPYITDMLNCLLGTQWALPIPTFGVLVAMAIMVSTWVVRRETERYERLGKLPRSTHILIPDLAMTSALAGMVGARVFHILEYPHLFIENPAAMIFTRAGFSIYGGFAFGVVAGALFLRRHSIPLLPMLDVVAPSMMLGYGIGRLGCQLSGDGDWGIMANLQLKPTWLPDWTWAQTYAGNIAGSIIQAPGVYPTPLYEAIAALLLFGTLLSLRSRKHHDGYLFSLYLMLAGFERLLIEKIRINARYHWFDIAFTQAELISCLIIVAGLVGVLTTQRTSGIMKKSVFAMGVVLALSACAPR